MLESLAQQLFCVMIILEAPHSPAVLYELRTLSGVQMPPAHRQFAVKILVCVQKAQFPAFLCLV